MNSYTVKAQHFIKTYSGKPKNTTIFEKQKQKANKKITLKCPFKKLFFHMGILTAKNHFIMKFLPFKKKKRKLISKTVTLEWSAS